MWKVMICDDEPEVCQEIEQSLLRFAHDAGETFEIRRCSSAEELLEQWQEDNDILLLDIRMQGMTGMEAARELRKRGSRVAILFITTMVQYAMEGYEVHAYGFMKKPLREKQFHLQLEDVLRYLRRTKGKPLLLNTNFITDVICSTEIVYAEAFGHKIEVLLSDGRRITHGIPLGELERQLPPENFFRCHKSYLVNLQHIRQIGLSELLLTGGAHVPLSRHRRRELLQVFAGNYEWRV